MMKGLWVGFGEEGWWWGFGNDGKNCLGGWMDYRRFRFEGERYAFTVVTYGRSPWLCEDIARVAMRDAIEHVRKRYPFSIEAMVLLSDHLHCIWTLPEGDSDYSTHWRLIKTYVTRKCADHLNLSTEMTESRWKRGERNLWQRRHWEHWIRDDVDFSNQCNYIHNNPVKHGYCETPTHWQYSTIHRFPPKKRSNPLPHHPQSLHRST